MTKKLIQGPWTRNFNHGTCLMCKSEMDGFFEFKTKKEIKRYCNNCVIEVLNCYEMLVETGTIKMANKTINDLMKRLNNE